jgi:succinate-acetate transporter protein
MAVPIPSPSAAPKEPVRLVHSAEEVATGPLGGDPAILGLPSFIVGAVALAMVLIGVVPATAVGASLPIILAATSTGLFLATIWSAVIGQNASAGIYGIFGGFFLSYAGLVLGLTHNWFGIAPTAVADTQKLFVISWLVVVTVLVLATLRLPVVFTALFTLVDVALLLNLLSIIQSSSNMTKAAGWVAIAFSALGAYLFFGSASHATGGKAVPLGTPVLHT